MSEILKYPRTPHLAGSRLQPGDEDLAQVPIAELVGRWVVVEEKLDGSNAGISFDGNGGLRLQSRGHLLVGGPNEWQFDRFKAWAAQHRDELWNTLGDRYVCYGEWLAATHTIFYDALADYFVEFDVWDRGEGGFLDTQRRRSLLSSLPMVSAPVIWQGWLDHPIRPAEMVSHSRYTTTDVAGNFAAAASAAGLTAHSAAQRADLSGLAEGLYIKVETQGVVAGRYKWVRAGFTDAVASAGDHWSSLPMIHNQLARRP